MNNDRPICVLVAALGGQGGGVLADWLVAAARIKGLKAQATSIPGVAQRTGATTYYFEVYPQHELAARPGRPARPVFSIYPAAGSVDLMVSFEPMEAARALSGGFICENTTVITARERIFSTAEKIKPGDGAVPAGPVLQALQGCAGALRTLDMNKTARCAGCHPNAVMFGAMAASGVLPMSADNCREAITHAGVAVASNLAGFAAGMNLSEEPATFTDEASQSFKPAPEELAPAVSALPEAVQPMAGHATAHLLDYQDEPYARRYLERLGKVIADDSGEHDYKLSVLVARRLAAWMAFEDVARVAELKIRPGRLARIRRELAIDDDVPLTVHDYLKPSRGELEGVLPAALGNWLPKRQAVKHGGGIALKVRTSGPIGWLVLRSLAALKAWRPATVRFKREQEMIERWLQSVTSALHADYELACDVAELAVWARGYGDVRHRGFARLAQILDDWPQHIAADRKSLGETVRQSLAQAHTDPDAEVTP